MLLFGVLNTALSASLNNFVHNEVGLASLL